MTGEKNFKPDGKIETNTHVLWDEVKGKIEAMGLNVEQLKLTHQVLRFQITNERRLPVGEEEHHEFLNAIKSSSNFDSEMNSGVKIHNHSVCIEISKPGYTPTPPVDFNT